MFFILFICKLVSSKKKFIWKVPSTVAGTYWYNTYSIYTLICIYISIYIHIHLYIYTQYVPSYEIKWGKHTSKNRKWKWIGKFHSINTTGQESMYASISLIILLIRIEQNKNMSNIHCWWNFKQISIFLYVHRTSSGTFGNIYQNPKCITLHLSKFVSWYLLYTSIHVSINLYCILLFLINWNSLNLLIIDDFYEILC